MNAILSLPDVLAAGPGLSHIADVYQVVAERFQDVAAEAEAEEAGRLTLADGYRDLATRVEADICELLAELDDDPDGLDVSDFLEQLSEVDRAVHVVRTAVAALECDAMAAQANEEESADEYDEAEADDENPDADEGDVDP